MESECKDFLDRMEKFKEEVEKIEPKMIDVKNIWDLRGTYDHDTLFEEATNMNTRETGDFLRTLEESCVPRSEREKIKEFKSRSDVILSLEEGSDELPGECANLTSFKDEVGSITFPTHDWDNKDKRFIEKTYDFFEQVQKICEGAEQRTNNENTQDNE